MIDAKLLKTFLILSKHRHFGRAAEELHATQPGVSQHIAKLEEQLGFVLLTRNSRGVELTAAGSLVAARAAQILSALDGLASEGKQLDAGQAGTLSLGLSWSVLFSEALRTIRLFREAYPLITVRVSVHSSTVLSQMMSTGEIEVALTTLPSIWQDRQGYHVWFQEMGLAMLRQGDVEDGPPVSLSSFADQPFIVVPREMHPEMHDALISHFKNIGSTIRIAASEVPFWNVFARVAIGEGVGLVPLCLAHSAPMEVKVCRILDNPLPPIEVRAVTNRGPHSMCLTRFLEYLTKNAR
jgi:DNA-binding transcriptional LysR family regulator